MGFVKFLQKIIGLTFLLCSVVYGDYFFFSPEKIAAYLKTYKDEEKREIEKDLGVVRSVCCGKRDGSAPFYLATAGGPGARKSTILERFLRDYPAYSQAVYLDPDQRALKFMAHTYYAQSLSAYKSALAEDYLSVRRAAYEKWRGASNYITFTLLEEALQKRESIVHGTTSTAEFVPAFLQKLRAAGYKIILMLCMCDDDVRKEGVEYRNQEQKFYQSTPEDGMAKAELFFEKFPVYFTYADTLLLYWSDTLFSEARLAAVFNNGEMHQEDCCALDLVQRKYEQDRELVNMEGKNLPAWNEIVTMYFSRFKK